MATDDEKYLDKPGLGHLIGLIKGAISTVQGAVDDLEQQVEDAGGVSVDNTTIKKSASGVLSAIMDVAGGVTSLSKHNADIVVDDGATTSKSGNAISVRAGGIQSSHLSNGCVTTDKIASSAVTSDKLADGSVETSAIADGAVTPEKISDLAELRGEMGLGNTLGALPVSSGGTGVTSLSELTNLFRSVQTSISGSVTNEDNPSISRSFSKFAIPEGFSISDFSMLILVSVTFTRGSNESASVHSVIVPFSSVIGTPLSNPARLSSIAWRTSNNVGYVNFYAAEDSGEPCVGTQTSWDICALESVGYAYLVR